MIDKTSKQVVKYMQNLEGAMFYVYKGYPDFISKDEFNRSIVFLESAGFVRAERGAHGILIKAGLTHQGVHFREFTTFAVIRYALDKWIDLLALAISLAAFVGAYRGEITAMLQTLVQAMPK